MKRKLKMMYHQIDQLKEEITSKEAALVKEHLEHQRVEKEKDALKVYFYISVLRGKCWNTGFWSIVSLIRTGYK